MKQVPGITLLIDGTGKNVVVEVDGVQGPPCVALTRELEDALGSLVKRELKPEHTALDLDSTRKQGQSLGGKL